MKRSNRELEPRRNGDTSSGFGDSTLRSEMNLMINRTNGERIGVPVICRLDTAEEVYVYASGGVLQRFAQDFLEGNASSKRSEI